MKITEWKDLNQAINDKYFLDCITNHSTGELIVLVCKHGESMVLYLRVEKIPVEESLAALKAFGFDIELK